ncbi:hypothetical protein VZT92_018097 [Zoarces viviparus]|uniref:Uncharacterized protein n=2 Tax=Zoarces viviparus TaxID=48416 RepID=A0AAW1EPY2_ZOAVI
MILLKEPLSIFLFVFLLKGSQALNLHNPFTSECRTLKHVNSPVGFWGRRHSPKAGAPAGRPELMSLFVSVLTSDIMHGSTRLSRLDARGVPSYCLQERKKKPVTRQQRLHAGPESHSSDLRGDECQVVGSPSRRRSPCGGGPLAEEVPLIEEVPLAEEVPLMEEVLLVEVPLAEEGPLVEVPLAEEVPLVEEVPSWRSPSRRRSPSWRRSPSRRSPSRRRVPSWRSPSRRRSPSWRRSPRGGPRHM